MRKFLDGPASTITVVKMMNNETNSPTREKNNFEIINTKFAKNSMGLGFCIEGGMSSVLGDKPITVKKLYGGKLLNQDKQ